MSSELNPDSVYPELRERVDETTNYVPKDVVNQIRKTSQEEGFVVYRSRTESIFRQVDFIKTPKQKRKSLISRKSFSRKKSSNLDVNSSATSKRFTPQDTPIFDSLSS